MLILGIETSSTVASVALMNKDVLLGEVVVNSTKTHSQKLMPILDQLLKNCGVTIKELDLIGVSTGPGSFTGVRIGISTAKGLAHPFNIPLVEVSSLEGMGYNMPQVKGLICPIFDARRDLVYTRVMKWTEEGIETLIEDENILIDELIEQLKAYDEPVTFVGDGVLKFAERLRESLGERAIMAPQNVLMPKGSSIAEAARQALITSYKKYDEVKANYLRKTEAERNYEEKHGKL